MGIYRYKMGVKFFRGADKPKKIRKRLSQSRSWFRSFKWVCYHAHPTFVTGHDHSGPFKGAAFVPFALLAHPDMKMFNLNDSALFVPPRPTALASAAGIGA